MVNGDRCLVTLHVHKYIIHHGCGRASVMMESLRTVLQNRRKGSCEPFGSIFFFFLKVKSGQGFCFVLQAAGQEAHA